MKNLFILILCLAACSVASAHTKVTSLDSAANSELDDDQARFGRRFQEYWFVSAGAGAQAYYGDHNRRMRSFGERITPLFDLRGGYWFDEDFGVRTGINGFAVNGLTQNESHLAGNEWYEESQRLKRQQISYVHVSVDGMYRMLNFIEDDRRDRRYELLPYIGVGVIMATSQPKATNLTFSIGVNNVYHINRTWGVTFDIRAMLTGDGFDGERGGLRGEGILSTSAGVVYNIRY